LTRGGNRLSIETSPKIWWVFDLKEAPQGPLSWEELQDTLASEGISDRALVWRPGAEHWMSLASLSALPQLSPLPEIGSEVSTPPVETCSICGHMVPPNFTVFVLKRTVCVHCKPLFLQALREGAPLPGAPMYGTFGQRAAAKLIDQVVIVGAANALVAQLFLWLTELLGLNGSADSPTLGYVALSGFYLFVLPFTIPIVYNVFFLARYGATLGKMAFGLRVVTSTGNRVSAWRALGRYFAEMISALVLYIGYLVAAFDEERRTWHDQICDTRVIRT